MKTYNKNAAATAPSPLFPYGSKQQLTLFGKKQQPMGALATSPYKEAIKSLVGHPLNSDTLLHYNTKSVVYSFNKVNNLYPLLTAQATEYLLKSLFRSMFSLISRPVYLIKHDKIIIRLFVFLSPKIDKYLDTSTIVQLAEPANLQSANSRRLFRSGKGGASLLYLKKIALGKFLKFKSLRPKAVEILKSQARSEKLGSSITPFLFFSSNSPENSTACGSFFKKALRLAELRQAFPWRSKGSRVREQEAASTASLVKGSQSSSTLALQEQSKKRQGSFGPGKDAEILSGASSTYPYIS